MSQRIEKGGARFKPSIVPRRAVAGGAATPLTASSSPSSSAASTPGPAQKRPSQPTTAPTAATPAAALASSPNSTAAAAVTQQSPASRPAQSPSLGPSTPSTSGTAAGKSFAFTQSPARIIVPSRHPSASPSLAPAVVGQAAGPSTFRRPSISRTAPGSRTCVTPGSSGERRRAPSIPPLLSDTLGGSLVTPASAPSQTASASASTEQADAPKRKKAFAISAGSGRNTRNDACAEDVAEERRSGPPTIGASSSGNKRLGAARAAGEMPPPAAAATRGLRRPAAGPTAATVAATTTTAASSLPANSAVTSSNGALDGVATGEANCSTSTTVNSAPATAALAAVDGATRAFQPTIPAASSTDQQDRQGETQSAATLRANTGLDGEGRASGHNSAVKGKERATDDENEPSRPHRKGATRRAKAIAADRANAIAEDDADDDDSGSGNDFSDNDVDDDDDDSEEEEPPEVKKARAVKRAVKKEKRRLKRKEEANGKPKRPQSAYLLYVGAMRQQRRDELADTPLTQATSILAQAWRGLDADAKKVWEDKAAEARQEYELKLAEWKQLHPNGVSVGESDESGRETTSEVDDEGKRVRRKKARARGRDGAKKKRTISDDEREYFEQIDNEGPGLAESRIDASSITMGDLSVPDFKRGRAGPRTFELERVRRRQAEERKTAMKELQEQIETQKRLGVAATSAATPSFQTGEPSSSAAGRSNEIVEGEEEVVDNGDNDNDDDDDGGSNDGGSRSSRRPSRRSASAAATEHSFTENRFAVQTRIVDGKIVVDESSLFANFGNGEDFREGMEVIDEREGDRFVNSATRGKGFGRNKRWTDDDTAKFYRAVQQWGTDFEMISRLFPGRDRAMIKKKWNAEERANPKMIDDALNNRLAIDLDAYSRAAGMDFSGPPPEISASLGDFAGFGLGEPISVKKRESTAPVSGGEGGDEDDEDEWEYEEVIEIDDDGSETVSRKRIGRKGDSNKKKRRTSRKASNSQAPAERTISAAVGVSVAGSLAAAPAAESAARPPAIGSRRSNSVASTPATSSGPGGGRRMSRSDPSTVAAMERERRHRTSELLVSEAPTDRMEVEEILGDA
ncbi:hypothetical protein ACQY0O_007623 [Thecaphora frezii]